jgi:hypothetical protein
MVKKKKVPIKNRGSSAQGAGKEKTGFRKLILGTIFALVVIQVALANSMVTRGRGIGKLTAEREKLRGEITALENTVAQAASLVVIRQEAAELGMGPGKIEFLPPPPLASAP